MEIGRFKLTVFKNTQKLLNIFALKIFDAVVSVIPVTGQLKRIIKCVVTVTTFKDLDGLNSLSLIGRIFPDCEAALGFNLLINSDNRHIILFRLTYEKN